MRLSETANGCVCSSAERTRRVAAENRIAQETEQRGEAEARAQAACEALESARGVLSNAAVEKEEAQARAKLEALKRQAEEQVGSRCISISSSHVLKQRFGGQRKVCVFEPGAGYFRDLFFQTRSLYSLLDSCSKLAKTRNGADHSAEGLSLCFNLQGNYSICPSVCAFDE